MTRFVLVLTVAAAGAPAWAMPTDKADPAKPLIVEGDKLFEEGKLDDAMVKYVAAEKANPKNCEVQLSMGAVYMSKKEHAPAVAAYEKAAALDPNEPDAWKGMAGAALAAKDWAAVEKAASGMEKVDPGAPEPARMRGEVAMAQEKFDAAYKQFQAAVALDPRVKRGKGLLAFAAMKLGKKDEAISILKGIMESSQRSYDAVKKDKRFETLMTDPVLAALKAPGKPELAEGKPAPAFTLATLESDDKKVSLEAYRGKLLLVNFWASW